MEKLIGKNSVRQPGIRQEKEEFVQKKQKKNMGLSEREGRIKGYIIKC